jgi:hypothetical protein
MLRSTVVKAIPPAVQTVLEIVDEVFPVDKQDVLRAAQICQTSLALSARDAIHIASWNGMASSGF